MNSTAQKIVLIDDHLKTLSLPIVGTIDHLGFVSKRMEQTNQDLRREIVLSRPDLVMVAFKNCTREIKVFELAFRLVSENKIPVIFIDETYDGLIIELLLKIPGISFVPFTDDFSTVLVEKICEALSIKI